MLLISFWVWLFVGVGVIELVEFDVFVWLAICWYIWLALV